MGELARQDTAAEQGLLSQEEEEEKPGRQFNGRKNYFGDFLGHFQGHFRTIAFIQAVFTCWEPVGQGITICNTIELTSRRWGGRQRKEEIRG